MFDTAYLFAALAPLAPAFDAIVGAFAKLFSRFHWVSLLSAALLAYGVWLWQRREDPALANVGFLAFLFPRKVWLHRSALLDYRFVLFDKIALALLLGLLAMAVAPGGAEALAGAGEAMVDDAVEASLAVVVAYTITLVLVEDFCRYWAHRIMHWSPVLWQFHKVHHSPEVLVPISQLRTHPVNGIVNLIRSGVSIGVVTGIFLLVFPGQLTAMSILGVNAGRFLFNLAGAQLRHSHVWLSFGPILSRIVISPAQHQIHHSKAHAHHNRNYGSQLALWDWMFGTLYVPEKRERLDFGISEAETEKMRSVAGLYIQPFRDARALLRRRRERRQADRAARQAA